MSTNTVAYKAAKLRHDLAQASLDADLYAIQLRETSIFRLVTEKADGVAALARTEEMMREALRLVGSLEVAQHALQRLEEMGAQP
ncbi:MAG: hypothetical protein AB7D37_18450 [Desulfovibrio sp.]